jgi:nucleoside-diphosphate-sugar epimerase
VYPVFDLTTSEESMRNVLGAAAREFGFTGTLQFASMVDDLFAKAMSTTFNGCSGRAKTILGWEPKKYGLISGMDIFARAWVASKLEV